MEIKGKIIKILPQQSGEGRNGAWKRQEYVLEYGDQYPKIVCFSLRGDKIDQYPVKIDDEVVVSFNVESREYNNRYYTDIKAWRIDKAEGYQGQQNAAPAAAHSTAQAPEQQNDFSNNSEKDDLPF